MNIEEHKLCKNRYIGDYEAGVIVALHQVGLN